MGNMEMRLYTKLHIQLCITAAHSYMKPLKIPESSSTPAPVWQMIHWSQLLSDGAFKLI